MYIIVFIYFYVLLYGWIYVLSEMTKLSREIKSINQTFQIKARNDIKCPPSRPSEAYVITLLHDIITVLPM